MMGTIVLPIRSPPMINTSAPYTLAALRNLRKDVVEPCRSVAKNSRVGSLFAPNKFLRTPGIVGLIVWAGVGGSEDQRFTVRRDHSTNAESTPRPHLLIWRTITFKEEEITSLSTIDFAEALRQAITSIDEPQEQLSRLH